MIRVSHHIYYTPTTKGVCVCVWGGYNGFVFVASVGPSVRLHYRVRSINPILIEGIISFYVYVFVPLKLLR
jgi:hypothetical protein